MTLIALLPKRLSRSGCHWAIWAMMLVLPLTVQAELASHVQMSANLQRDGMLVAERDVPMILMVSAEECPYCMVMESDYLVPLLRNRAYEERVLIRKIHLDSFDEIIDFSGESVAPTDISQRYGVWVTPTLLFLNGEGEEMQKRMVGLGVRDFVSAYIDESIDAAAGVMRGLLPGKGG